MKMKKQRKKNEKKTKENGRTVRSTVGNENCFFLVVVALVVVALVVPVKMSFFRV